MRTGSCLASGIFVIPDDEVPEALKSSATRNVIIGEPGATTDMYVCPGHGDPVGRLAGMNAIIRRAHFNPPLLFPLRRSLVKIDPVAKEERDAST